MLLDNKTVVIYEADGTLGSAVARAFAREQAYVFLAGPNMARLDLVAEQIVSAGGVAESAVVDALDEQAVEEHAEEVASWTGGIDVSLNAVDIPHTANAPLVELAAAEFTALTNGHTRSQFLTARAVGRHMVARGSGLILTLAAVSAAPDTDQRLLRIAGGAVEEFSRQMADELGGHGVRVVCLHTVTADSRLPDPHRPTGRASTRAGRARPPALTEIADAIVLIASDRTAATTGTVAQLTCVVGRRPSVSPRDRRSYH